MAEYTETSLLESLFPGRSSLTESEVIDKYLEAELERVAHRAIRESVNEAFKKKKSPLDRGRDSAERGEELLPPVIDYEEVEESEEGLGTFDLAPPSMQPPSMGQNSVIQPLEPPKIIYPDSMGPWDFARASRASKVGGQGELSMVGEIKPLQAPGIYYDIVDFATGLGFGEGGELVRDDGLDFSDEEEGPLPGLDPPPIEYDAAEDPGLPPPIIDYSETSNEFEKPVGLAAYEARASLAGARGSMAGMRGSMAGLRGSMVGVRESLVASRASVRNSQVLPFDPAVPEAPLIDYGATRASLRVESSLRAPIIQSARLTHKMLDYAPSEKRAIRPIRELPPPPIFYLVEENGELVPQIESREAVGLLAPPSINYELLDIEDLQPPEVDYSELPPPTIFYEPLAQTLEAPGLEPPAIDYEELDPFEARADLPPPPTSLKPPPILYRPDGTPLLSGLSRFSKKSFLPPGLREGDPLVRPSIQGFSEQPEQDHIIIFSPEEIEREAEAAATFQFTLRPSRADNEPFFGNLSSAAVLSDSQLGERTSQRFSLVTPEMLFKAQASVLLVGEAEELFKKKESAQLPQAPFQARLAEEEPQVVVEEDGDFVAPPAPEIFYDPEFEVEVIDLTDLPPPMQSDSDFVPSLMPAPVIGYEKIYSDELSAPSIHYNSTTQPTFFGDFEGDLPPPAIAYEEFDLLGPPPLSFDQVGVTELLPPPSQSRDIPELEPPPLVYDSKFRISKVSPQMIAKVRELQAKSDADPSAQQSKKLVVIKDLAIDPQILELVKRNGSKVFGNTRKTLALQPAPTLPPDELASLIKSNNISVVNRVSSMLSEEVEYLEKPRRNPTPFVNAGYSPFGTPSASSRIVTSQAQAQPKSPSPIQAIDPELHELRYKTSLMERMNLAFAKPKTPDPAALAQLRKAESRLVSRDFIEYLGTLTPSALAYIHKVQKLIREKTDRRIKAKIREQLRLTREHNSRLAPSKVKSKKVQFKDPIAV